MLETPGHTGTLGFGGQHRYNHTGGGAGTGARQDHRASYSTLGSMMMMDLSYTAGGAENADLSHSR